MISTTAKWLPVVVLASTFAVEHPRPITTNKKRIYAKVKNLKKIPQRRVRLCSSTEAKTAFSKISHSLPVTCLFKLLLSL